MRKYREEEIIVDKCLALNVVSQREGPWFDPRVDRGCLSVWTQADRTNILPPWFILQDDVRNPLTIKKIPNSNLQNFPYFGPNDLSLTVRVCSVTVKTFLLLFNSLRRTASEYL